MRGQNAGPSVRPKFAGRQKEQGVRIMTYRKTFAVCLSAAALILATGETFAASGTHAGVSAHRTIGPARHHHRGHGIGGFWYGDSYYDPTTGEPPLDVAQPAPRNAYASDTIPWDWAHRYPPIVTDPTAKPYVPECHGQTVSVPGNSGDDQTVNILRCY